MKGLILITIIFISFNLLAAKKQKPKLIGVFYYQELFGHIHQTPDQYSPSLTTISCAHPLKVYEPIKLSKKGWNYIQTAGVEGYVQEKYLDQKKPKCFQNRYPKFMNEVDLSLTEMYYWGRLYDMYSTSESKLK